jgi:hypothetical protein
MFVGSVVLVIVSDVLAADSPGVDLVGDDVEDDVREALQGPRSKIASSWSLAE